MIEYAVFTDAGEQEANEDTVKVFINQPLQTYAFVLADGLGGCGNGKTASEFVADFTGAAMESAPTLSDNFLDQCFSQAQELLMQEKKRSGQSAMKTTMVLLLLKEGIARWGHIGDSRLYLFRRDKVLRQTLDHSVPQMLAISGQIRQKDIRHHPDRSRLLRAMGAHWDEPMYEIDEHRFLTRKGDTFLLCSDGFWEWIDEKTMLQLIKKGAGAYETLQNMVREIRTAGKEKDMDNFSAILINIK